MDDNAIWFSLICSLCHVLCKNCSIFILQDNFELPSKMKLLKREIDLVTQLSRTSYKDKFHMLLYWEEHAHVKALQERYINN